MTITSTAPGVPARKPGDLLFVGGIPRSTKLPPGVCMAPGAASDDVCPTYGGEYCPDNQALIDKCQHC